MRANYYSTPSFPPNLPKNTYYAYHKHRTRNIPSKKDVFSGLSSGHSCPASFLNTHLKYHQHSPSLPLVVMGCVVNISQTWKGTQGSLHYHQGPEQHKFTWFCRISWDNVNRKGKGGRRFVPIQCGWVLLAG